MKKMKDVPFARIALVILAFWGCVPANCRSSEMLVGVSLAGPEFGAHLSEFSNQNPGSYGKEYTFPTEETIEYFSKAGVVLLRLPFRWERLQRELGGELEQQYLYYIKQVARLAASHRVYVILDVHNYGRYRLQHQGVAREFVIDEVHDGMVPVSRAHFTDLWRRLAVEFRGNTAIVGYGLMNEPHDMGTSDWKVISQAAVDAIRKYDRETAVIVAGDDWSSAERFPLANGPKPWIRDPAKHVVYEAHCYFDSDASGKYQQSFAEEARLDPDIAQRGLDRVKPFLNWCHRNHVRGLIGEYGTPPDPEWRAVTLEFLKACQKSQVGVCYWAAGEWWGDYPLSVQPKTDQSAPAQLRWIKQVKEQTD